ncbi:MAG: hypothetical protein ABI599_06985 [Flavobacteriales bacterium]
MAAKVSPFTPAFSWFEIITAIITSFLVGMALILTVGAIRLDGEEQKKANHNGEHQPNDGTLSDDTTSIDIQKEDLRVQTIMAYGTLGLFALTLIGVWLANATASDGLRASIESIEAYTDTERGLLSHEGTGDMNDAGRIDFKFTNLGRSRIIILELTHWWRSGATPSRPHFTAGSTQIPLGGGKSITTGRASVPGDVPARSGFIQVTEPAQTVIRNENVMCIHYRYRYRTIAGREYVGEYTIIHHPITDVHWSVETDERFTYERPLKKG